ILCIGEGYDQREAGETEAVLKKQLEEGLQGVTAEQMASCIIAYEPIWAIGTGLTASPEQAGTMHTAIRLWLKSHFGHENAEGTRIIYGGSVKGSNASDLAAIDGIDGALVGGASLSASEFSQIARAFRTHPQ
ncbi:MAG TPA: triose-phosphate isomerase, partial [Saprospiraceae bacterium]|nr:triose-phosphate isomerase [Saprospiraceae bacterium]